MIRWPPSVARKEKERPTKTQLIKETFFAPRAEVLEIIIVPIWGDQTSLFPKVLYQEALFAHFCYSNLTFFECTIHAAVGVTRLPRRKKTLVVLTPLRVLPATAARG